MIPREKLPKTYRPISKAQWEHMPPSPIREVVQVGEFLLLVTLDVSYFIDQGGKQVSLPIKVN